MDLWKLGNKKSFWNNKISARKSFGATKIPGEKILDP